MTRERSTPTSSGTRRQVARGHHARQPSGQPSRPAQRSSRGRVSGCFKENVLLEQAFARDPKKSVAKVLDRRGAAAKQFVRFRVGA